MRYDRRRRGDFYGNGRLPPPGYGSVVIAVQLVDRALRIISAACPSEISLSGRSWAASGSFRKSGLFRLILFEP